MGRCIENMRDHLQHNLYPSVNYSPFNPYSHLNIPVENNIFSVSHYTRSTLEVLVPWGFFFPVTIYLCMWRGCKSLSLEAVGGFLELPFIENHGNIQ